MKHLILLSLFTFHSSLFTLSASAAVPLKWTVETSRLAPAVFDVVRGETIAIEAAFNSSGKPFAMDGEPVSIFWHTNGMGNAWWTAPAAATSNLVRATFTPEMDPGAATVNGFLGSSGSIYRAAFTFRFRHGPGAVPNTLPLPVPVIDFAKVRVLNPPWSGGGVDTNAVRDIAREEITPATNRLYKTLKDSMPDGEGRYLQPYLHYKEMDDTYPEAAAEWYVQADYSHGSCSALRIGNLFERNYDWNFNDMPEYVIRIPAGPGRFASLAVCNVGTNLTEADVTSGKHLRWLKALPGHAVDGINSEGVVAEVNVVDGEPQWGSGVPPLQPIHPLGAVRWVLDHATNAQHGAEYIAANIRFPEGWTQNFHYMIADATSTWIVENGHAYNSGEAASSPLVLTNFRLYPSRDTTGEGQERYDALAAGASITSQWWTLTYTPQGYRASDLPGITGEALNQLFDYWASKPREAHRGEKFHSTTTPSDYDYTWWQTVHCSVYDITNRTLRVAVQETDDWYTFQMPSSGAKVDAYTKAETDAKLTPIEAQIESLQSGKADKSTTYTKTETDAKLDEKRDKTDLDVFKDVWSTDVSISPCIIKWSYDGPEGDGWYIFRPDVGAEASRAKGDRYSTVLHWGAEDSILGKIVTATRTIEHTNSKLAHTSATYGLAKFGTDGELTQAAESDIPGLSDKFDKTGGEIVDRDRAIVKLIGSGGLFGGSVKISSPEAGGFGGRIEMTANYGSSDAPKIILHDTDGHSVGIDKADILLGENSVRDAIEDVPNKRDREDNTCHKSEFGEWSLSYSDGVDHHWELPIVYGRPDLGWANRWVTSAYPLNDKTDPNETVLVWRANQDWDQPFTMTATRSAVCTYGEKFTTPTYVDGKVSAAVSTNNPAFVSAVRNTPTSGMPEDMPTDWGTYGTVGAALAALAAGLKWCKNILGTLATGFSTFAEWIASKFDTAKAVKEFASTSTYEVGEIVLYGGTAYKCTTAVTTAGAWTGSTNWAAATDADLAARLKNLKSNGFATDAFATDLLGKQVAKTALMIPLEAKTDSFAAEDGHAYAVTMTGTVTITMPTVTEGKAAIFQARFSAAAQQSVQFSTTALVKFDGTDCGIVKAGKDALLSAMWNGEAWDLVWKNEA